MERSWLIGLLAVAFPIPAGSATRKAHSSWSAHFERGLAQAPSGARGPRRKGVIVADEDEGPWIGHERGLETLDRRQIHVVRWLVEDDERAWTREREPKLSRLAVRERSRSRVTIRSDVVWLDPERGEKRVHLSARIVR